MKDYAAMSDFEINSAVHNALLDKPYELTFHGGGKITWKNKDSGMVIETGIVGYTKNGLHDYCNNPADAWPIIVDNHIAVANFGDGNSASWSTKWGMVSNFYAEGENPLRCAMVVFLMMKEGE